MDASTFAWGVSSRRVRGGSSSCIVNVAPYAGSACTPSLQLCHVSSIDTSALDSGSVKVYGYAPAAAIDADAKGHRKLHGLRPTSNAEDSVYAAALPVQGFNTAIVYQHPIGKECVRASVLLKLNMHRVDLQDTDSAAMYRTMCSSGVDPITASRVLVTQLSQLQMWQHPCVAEAGTSGPAHEQSATAIAHPRVPDAQSLEPADKDTASVRPSHQRKVTWAAHVSRSVHDIWVEGESV